MSDDVKETKDGSVMARIRELMRRARQSGSREPLEVRVSPGVWAELNPELAKVCTYKVTDESPVSVFRWKGSVAAIDGAPVYLAPDMEAGIMVSSMGESLPLPRTEMES